ncbi:MAG: hypothetical protein ACRDU5_03780 [Mycobacterium sp.]
MNIRAIATRTIAGIALAGALTGVGAGVAASTANAKPGVCASYDKQENHLVIALSQYAEVEDWDGVNYYWGKLEALNQRATKAGCRS